MNIKDLNPGEYQVISTPTNINQLQPGSYSVTPPSKPKRTLLQKAATIADYASFGVGKTTGEAIGTGLGALYTKGKDLIKRTNDYQYYDLSTPSPVQVAADAAAGAFTVAGFKGLAPGKSLLRTSLKEAGLDAGAGATTEIARNKDATAGSIAGQAALWGAAGATLPSLIKGGSGVVKALSKEGRAAKRLAKTTEAVDPLLTGEAKVQAYKDIAKGRDFQPAKIFKEQGLSPSERTVNLARRLSQETPIQSGGAIKGVRFGKKPLENLRIIGESLKETENALEKELRNNAKLGDKSLSFHLDKSTLFNRLEQAKKNAPREFNRVRDSKAIYDDVMDFAKEQINKAEDSIAGGRAARTAFDMQARKEYKSVFKDGFIDDSTPAGSAIKAAREIINEHIYNTAPNGSTIRNLIGREADLLNARDISAIKASKLHGKDWWDAFARNNPRVAGALKWLGFAATVTGLGYVGGQAVQAIEE